MNLPSLIGKSFLKIYQTFPQLIPFFGIYYGLLTVNYWLLAFGISAIFSNVSNKAVKTIMKLIYNASGNKTLPVLGLGGRPKDARDCSAFTHCDTCHLRPKSFGMPSGHSQMGWFFFAYGILYLANHVLKALTGTGEDKINKVPAQIWFIVGSCFLFVMAVTLSYSRVYLSCHTVQQVVLGGFFGLGFGVLSYWVSQIVIEGDDSLKFLHNFRNLFEINEN